MRTLLIGTDDTNISREEMRSFKKVWDEFANPRTGYLEGWNFVRFSGVSYHEHFSYPCSRKSCRTSLVSLKFAYILRNTVFAVWCPDAVQAQKMSCFGHRGS